MFKNFLDIITEGLAMDGTGKLILWIVLAIAFSALCWWICTNYTKLWNKRYHVTNGFHALCGAAALVTFFTVLAFMMIVFIVVRKLVLGDPTPGWPSLACIIVFVAGLQMFGIGILGQYLAKTYMETKRRPQYIIAETNKEDAL